MMSGAQHKFIGREALYANNVKEAGS